MVSMLYRRFLLGSSLVLAMACTAAKGDAAEILVGCDYGDATQEASAFLHAQREWYRQAVALWLMCRGHRVLDAGLGDQPAPGRMLLACRLLTATGDAPKRLELQLPDQPVVIIPVLQPDALRPDDGQAQWQQLDTVLAAAWPDLARTAPAWKDAAAPAAGIEDVSTVGDFARARQLHALFATAPSPAIVQELAICYAELGKDCDWNLDSIRHIHLSRALLLGALLRHRGHEDIGLWTEAYAHALVGQPQQVRKLLDLVQERAVPAWAAGLRALLAEDPVALRDLAALDPLHARRYRRWAAYLLEFCGLDGVEMGTGYFKVNPHQGMRESLTAQALAGAPEDARLLDLHAHRRGTGGFAERSTKIPAAWRERILPAVVQRYQLPPQPPSLLWTVDVAKTATALRAMPDQGTPSLVAVAGQLEGSAGSMVWGLLREPQLHMVLSSSFPILPDPDPLSSAPLLRGVFALYGPMGAVGPGTVESLKSLPALLPRASLASERLRVRLGELLRNGVPGAGKEDAIWQAFHQGVATDWDGSLWSDLRFFMYLDHQGVFNLGQRQKLLVDAWSRHQPSPLVAMMMTQIHAGGLSKDAIAAVDGALREHPLLLPVRAGRARTSKTLPTLRPQLEAYVAQWPDAWSLNLLADVCESAGDQVGWAKAKLQIVDMLPDGNERHKAAKDLLVGLLDRKLHAEAELVAKDLLAEDPRSRHIQKLRALSLEYQGRMADADEAWRTARECWVAEMNRAFFARGVWYLFRQRTGHGDPGAAFRDGDYGHGGCSLLRAMIEPGDGPAFPQVSAILENPRDFPVWFQILGATCAHQDGDRPARDQALNGIIQHGQTYGRAFGKQLKALATYYASQPLQGGGKLHEEGRNFGATVQNEELPLMNFLHGRIEELQGHVAEAKAWYDRASLPLHRDVEEVGAIARVLRARLERLHPDIPPGTLGRAVKKTNEPKEKGKKPPEVAPPLPPKEPGAAQGF